MPDREKYIEVLSKAAKTVKEFSEDIPIKISLVCVEDILELLKEQEPKQVNDIAQQISCFSGICPSCGKMLNTTCNKNFCGECGQAVKWE